MGNVPLLLRRAADAIAEFGTAEIQDLVLHTVVNEFGDWPSNHRHEVDVL